MRVKLDHDLENISFSGWSLTTREVAIGFSFALLVFCSSRLGPVGKNYLIG
jgi:hypothetical protein